MSRQTSVAGVVVALVFGLLLCAQTHAQEDIRVIHVDGEASAMVDPDVIEWTLTLDTRAVDSDESLELNSIMMESVIALVDDFDIEEEDFETTHAQLRRVYRTNRDVQFEREYRYTKCARSAIIRMRDFEQFDELMTALVRIGVEFEIAYKVSNRKEIKHRLSLEALRNAKEIAQEQAQVLGEEIGAARRIEIYDNSNRNRFGSGSLFGDDRGDSDRETLRPGKIRIAVVADVTFTLVP